MPHTRTSPRIYFEVEGDPSAPPVVLIEGLGAQMVGWRDAFVAKLVARGLRVIRLDNRDVGLSDMLGSASDHAADYALADMAGDVCRVLDALDTPAAHIVGQSMGGAIAQTMAMQFPERVQSLVLFYTAPGFLPEFLGQAILDSSHVTPPPGDLPRAEAVQAYVDNQRVCASPAYGFDEPSVRALGEVSFDRAYRPDGILRQMSAMSRAQDLRPGLASVTAPSAIIHGRDDALVNFEAGIEIARHLPDSELHLYPGMGHQIAQPLWDDFATIIERTVQRGTAARSN